MRKLFAVLMVLVLCGMASAVVFMSAGETKPMIEVVMFQTADGITPITTLTGTNLTIYYSERPTGAAVIGDEITLALADWASDNTDWVTGTAIHIGHGVYRICLPTAAVDGAAHSTVTVCVNDETNAARNSYVRIQLSPPVDTVLTNGTTPPAITVADGHVEANVVSITSGIAAADVWNSLVADYTTTGTYGLQVGTGGGMVSPPGDTVAAGTAQGGSTNYITLSASDTATIDYYKGYSIRVMDVTDGFVAVRGISSYDNATKRAYVTSNWVSGREPTSGDTYIIAAPALPGGPAGTSDIAFLTGTARDEDGIGSTTGQIQLASTVNGIPEITKESYTGFWVNILSGTGAGQLRRIVGYLGHNSEHTFDNIAYVWPSFGTAPSTDSVYEIFVGPSSKESLTSYGTVVQAGSTRNTIVCGFPSTYFSLTKNYLLYTKITYLRAGSGGFISTSHICVGNTTENLTIFPSLPYDPATGDMIVISSDFGGLLLSDLAKMPN
jgi:hypothetical protein